LFGKVDLIDSDRLERLRQAVLDKNYHWFSRYRVVDGYNVFGIRSKLTFNDQTNAEVMKREMEIFDVMTANRDKRVWAVASGSDLEVNDDNIPAELTVKTTLPGALSDGQHRFLGGKEAIEKMRIADGMEVNLFASEEMFPRLINPVQMAVDTDSRLWASVWPSYPHWNPTESRKDALVILPDNNGDVVADDCIVFADELNCITGFEFWGGGVLVASPPEIWFLKDTNGDDKADYKLRVLQGVSSADSHHSANAMVIGPDGWLYWSRGIFNVTNMETPTRTYRSDSHSTGVHRFNPRTFETEFHFPVGPNPHGDVFDRWGYQFANDGTSGTGFYVNIGKGHANKQWYEKRVRPVPANGILSSSHFPEEVNGNFLLTNAIGFLGVLQHQIRYNGADITAHEIDPILVSSDPNFRPSDLKIGGDGALYVADWHNPLIGHMQHNIRDPNRDHQHGRIYRVTHKERPLLTPVKMKGQAIGEILENFFARENGTRYRARLELSSRDSKEVAMALANFTGKLDASRAAAERDEAQALLECLWVCEEHRQPDMELVKKTFKAKEPRVRAAAIRTLGHWQGRVNDWEPLLLAAADDASPLVQAEAVKAAAEYQGQVPAEVFFRVAGSQTDPELDIVLQYAREELPVGKVIHDKIVDGEDLSPAAHAYALVHSPAADLLKMKAAEAVFRAIIKRKDVPLADLQRAVDGLKTINETELLPLLLDLIHDASDQQNPSLSGLGKILLQQPKKTLQDSIAAIEDIAKNGSSKELRSIGYAAWIMAENSSDAAFSSAIQTKVGLREFLLAVPLLDPTTRQTLYGKIQPLIFELPAHLDPEPVNSAISPAGIKVDYFEARLEDASPETLNALQPVETGYVPKIELDIPQRKKEHFYALRFSGLLKVDRQGQYTFYLSSDDGSRLYVDGELVVDNDGYHEFRERTGSVKLTAAMHSIQVNYFESEYDAGLKVSWSGPGFVKQPLPSSRLSAKGNDTLHDVAINALTNISGHEAEKFAILTTLIKSGRN
ncbi:MAG: PA14 domain-containing protein, partial [Planctomycetales bacterium]